MRIEFTIQASCDFKTKTHGDDYELRFQAYDDENSEQYSKFFSMVRRGEGGLVDYLIATFESAFKEFGLSCYTGWSTAFVPDPHHAGEADCVAMVRHYNTRKAPRKRRYGMVTLSATLDWGYPLPYEPVAYRNPATSKANHAITQIFFANDFESTIEYTKETIEEGYAVAKTTLAFYEKMASIYEKKTGDKIDLTACAA